MKQYAYLLLGTVLVVQAAAIARTSGQIQSLFASSKSAAKLPSAVLVYHRSQTRELLGVNSIRQSQLARDKSLDLTFFVHDLTERLLPEQWRSSSRKIAQAILDTAKARQMDPLFVMSVIRQESVFNPDALGSAGEIGLMQIKPSTAQWLIDQGAAAPPANKDLTVALKDPATNIALGTAYLAYLRSKFKGGSLFIAAYNMGALNVRNRVKEGLRPRIYADKILAFYSEYAAGFRKYASRESGQRSIASIVPYTSTLGQ